MIELSNSTKGGIAVNECSTIKICFAGICVWISVILGGLDRLLIILIALSCADYITGIMNAIVSKTVSSKIGAKGIFRKITMFILIALCVLLDRQILGSENALRTTILLFYISNEGISVLENASLLGLPVPKKLRTLLLQINKDD